MRMDNTLIKDFLLRSYRASLEVFRGLLPLVIDVSHQQRAIELDASLGEESRIRKEAGVHVLDLERLYTPVLRDKRETIETTARARFGVPNRSLLEKR